jgi:D-tagatose-1,6-bisphosphate aldolase subunit GatZ/KbaZ
VYVAGSEVPVPGGAIGAEGLRVTPCSDVEITLGHLEEQFRAHDLDEAWSRVVAIVVQPGVEFSGDSIHAYDRAQAGELSQFIESLPGLVCEAHSTDYQQTAALRALVEDHFAILKVGPWLTFAYREAVFALAAIESELLRDHPENGSGLVDVLAREMDTDPRYWAPYFQGEGGASDPELRFSLSDRIRYYWNLPRVQGAVERMLTNLSAMPIPTGLVSQHFPEFWDLGLPGSSGRIAPALLVESRIRNVLDRYRTACGVFPG